MKLSCGWQKWWSGATLQGVEAFQQQEQRWLDMLSAPRFVVILRTSESEEVNAIYVWLSWSLRIL